MEETRIRSGTRVKLKRVDAENLPRRFLDDLVHLASSDARVVAVFLFALEPEGLPAQLSLALALKSRAFGKKDEDFLRLVEDIRGILPEDLGVNLYRYGSTEQLASFCAHSLEPLYVAHPQWIAGQRARLAPPSA
jgi:hypothetical protein